MFFSTLSAQSNNEKQAETLRGVEQKKVKLVENSRTEDVQRLQEMLQAEREERSKLELEREKLRWDKKALEEQREREEGE